jgi:hypothetical protein
MLQLGSQRKPLSWLFGAMYFCLHPQCAALHPRLRALFSAAHAHFLFLISLCCFAGAKSAVSQKKSKCHGRSTLHGGQQVGYHFFICRKCSVMDMLHKEVPADC